MSTLTRMLAWLWAALWVRWRLLGVRARRVFGGRVVAPVGAGYELPAAETPVEGIDYDAAELPDELLARLEGVRGGLLDHARTTAAARKRPRRARRRRTAAVALASLLTLAVVGGGAAALVTGSTGVPAVDRLLGIYEEQLSKPEAGERGGPSGQDLQPSATKASEPIEVRLSDGSRRVTTFYVARNDEMCIASVDPADDTTGTVGCESAERIPEDLQLRGGHVSGIDVRDADVVLKGYVGAMVEGLRGRGPDGPLHVRLGARWSPSVPGVAPLRPFVAVGRTSDGTRSRQRALTPQGYSFEAETTEGRKIEIRP